VKSIAAKAGDTVTDGWGNAILYLRQQAIHQAAESFVASLYTLLSDESVHPLTLIGNMLACFVNVTIEYGVMFLTVLDKRASNLGTEKPRTNRTCITQLQPSSEDPRSTNRSHCLAGSAKLDIPALDIQSIPNASTDERIHRLPSPLGNYPNRDASNALSATGGQSKPVAEQLANRGL